MGCCLSTIVTTNPTNSPDQDVVDTRKLPASNIKGGAKSDALVLDEDETVKEVLSETRTPSTSLAKIPVNTIPTSTTDYNYAKPGLDPNDCLKEPIEEQEEISVVSEMYSISGSFSATTVNDGDEGGEVNQRMIHHSPAKKRSNSRVNARAKNGGLRSLESSNFRVITRGYKSTGPSSQAIKSRPAQGRIASSTVQRRNVGRRDRDWQGLVECSGQRSGAPGAAASEVIRHRKAAVSSVTGHPGGRSQVRKLEESKRIENHEGALFSRESLDNPRVSLECFIFL